MISTSFPIELCLFLEFLSIFFKLKNLLSGNSRSVNNLGTTSTQKNQKKVVTLHVVALARCLE